MCVLCEAVLALQEPVVPCMVPGKEFGTDGLMALTATALLKALTVHLSTNSAAATSAALQTFLASKTYCSFPLFAFIALGSCGTPKVSHFIFL